MFESIFRPLTVHCSPGTGRTGTIISCDIAIRSLEQPTRNVDVPQIVYFVRRGRASAVQTREQYEFIYKVCKLKNFQKLIHFNMLRGEKAKKKFEIIFSSILNKILLNQISTSAPNI